MQRKTLYVPICQHTRAAFGMAVNPHLFRDCAATEIAISAPEHARMIRDILDHTDLATSERHYNLAGSLEAGRRYSHTLDALRSGEETETRPRARPRRK